MAIVVSDCDNCGADIQVLTSGASDEEERTLTGHVQVRSGWCLNLTGGYGMFNDDVSIVESVVEVPTDNVALCHDCSLKIARALPGVFSSRNGLHSMTADEKEKLGGKSCCEFAWEINENGDEVIGDGWGGWVKVDGTIIE